MRVLAFGLSLWLLLSGVSEACQLYRDVMRDSSGNVIAGVTVTVTLAGTSTAATLYSDDRCSTTLSNPLLSSTNGEFSFYAKDGEYGLAFAKSPGYTFTNISRLAIYDPLGENIVTVAKFITGDICATGTGAIDQIGATPMTLVVNRPVTCSLSKTIPATLKLQIMGNGLITVAAGKVLTLSEPSVIVSSSKQQIFAGSGTVSFMSSGIVYPRWWGVDGSADEVPINAAIASVPSNSTVFLEGSYTTNATILVNKDRVHLLGIGPYGTTIYFAPRAAGTAIKVEKSGSVAYQGSISNLALFSNDGTYTKVAIDLIDSSGYRLENIVIGGSVRVGSSYFWSGSSSIGLRVKGREFGLVKNLYNYADKPVVIADNPNSTIDIDHFHFQDLYLAANANPCVTIDDGVNLTNVTFDGANPWVTGTYGLYWNDTTTSQVSSNLSIKGLRTEQGTSATAYSIYISHNYTLQQLHLEDSQLDSARRGVYLRKVQNTLIQTTQYAGTREAFNFVGAIGQSITFQNTFWQAGSTAVLTNFKLQWAGAKPVSASPIPDNAQYAYDSGDANTWTSINGVYHVQFKGSLTNGSTRNLGIGTGNSVVVAHIMASAHGPTKDESIIVFTTATNGFKLAGTANTDVANSGGKWCVWKNGTDVSVTNNLGETVSYLIDVRLTQ